MITRSQKKRLEELTQRKKKFDHVIPIDLVIEIIRRLPAKQVARLLLVSKSLATIIRSKDIFTSRPLVAFIDIDRQTQHQDWYFFSPKSSSSSSSSYVSCVTFPLPYPEREYNAHYVNGLLRLGYGKEQQFITNPSTGQSIPLPTVKIRTTVNDPVIKTFFGYDSVNDQYKVLCMSEKELRRPMEAPPSSQHQVFTVKDMKKSWRMIKSNIPPHRSNSCSNGHVCIDGVVYYVAKTGPGLVQFSLMRFDLVSEKFDVFTSLPPDIKTQYLHDPINYQGKVALPTKTSLYTFEVWIMDQSSENHAWLKKSFNIQPWESLCKVDNLHIRGTSNNTGEFVLAPRFYSDEFNVVYYNPDKDSFRNIKVEVDADCEFKRLGGTRAIVFPDYVESIRSL